MNVDGLAAQLDPVRRERTHLAPPMSRRPCPTPRRWPGRCARWRASRPSDAGTSHRSRAGRPLAAIGPSRARDAGPSTAACPSPPGTDAPTRPRASSWPARLRRSGGPTELTHRLGTCRRSRWAHRARTTGARLCRVSSHRRDMDSDARPRRLDAGPRDIKFADAPTEASVGRSAASRPLAVRTKISVWPRSR